MLKCVNAENAIKKYIYRFQPAEGRICAQAVVGEKMISIEIISERIRFRVEWDINHMSIENCDVIRCMVRNSLAPAPDIKDGKCIGYAYSDGLCDICRKCKMNIDYKEDTTK